MKGEIKMWKDEGEPHRFKDMIGKKIKEPIHVVEHGDKSYIWDGNHRAGAAFLSGHTHIPAIVGTLKKK